MTASSLLDHLKGYDSVNPFAFMEQQELALAGAVPL